MQRFTFLFITLLFIAIGGKAQWTVGTTGTSSMYESIYFFDASNGIASSTNDVVKTTNGGTTWTTVSTAGIRDIDFANSTVGYAAGLSGTPLYKTTNGGSTWSALTPVSSTVMWGVSVVDANTVYVCGASGNVWKTTNGTTFSAVNISTTNTIIDLQFIDANTGCALEVTGNIWRTTNGGTTWSLVYSTIGIYYTSICFANSTTGFAVGSNGIINKTTDGGATWNTLTTNSTDYFQYVDFYDANNGMAVGLNGCVLRTTNGGSTWFHNYPPTPLSLYSCIMLSSTSAVAAGINGVVIKNSALGIEDSGVNPEAISVYPNPSSDFISISLPENYSGESKIYVYNVQGQILAERKVSELKTEFNVSDYSDGIYYIRIEGEKQTIIRKFIKG